MLSNEDILAISVLLDKKLESVKKDIADDMNSIRGDMNGIRGDMNSIRGDMNSIRSDMESGFQKISIILENNILPRLQNIESCYTTTYRRYQAGVNQIETMQTDIDILKKVVTEHSKQIQQQRIS